MDLDSRRLAALPAAALLLAASAAAQATIRVPQDQPTIQAAVAVAGAGDTVLVDPGTYVEQVDFLGKAITVRSSAGAAVTTIDSQGLETWFDFPTGAVVRFVNGEGPGSVLEGFTVTGGSSPFGLVGYSGIWCVGLTPTVRDCVIRDNSGGQGGGVYGDALLERCEIRGNDALPFGGGGGVYGAPTMVDCIVADNRSGDRGGGIYATGPMTITGGMIDGNVSGNGFDGYSGGGVFGPATITGTVISNNVGNHYLSGGPPDVVGCAVDGVVALTRCTLVGNRVGAPEPGEPSGAIKGSPVVVDCIVWGNDVPPFAVGSAPPTTYSIVEGGAPGTGNLAVDPLFVDAAGGDYSLQLGSPAVDAGDPTSPNDPDGTRADMGALFFPQFPASVVSRNGSGANPVCYTTSDLPVIGTTMGFDVDATAHGLPATLTFLVFYEAPAPFPLPTAFGEVLVDPTSGQAATSTAAVVGGTSAHGIAIPPDYSLGGRAFASQAIVFGGGAGLCNALDVTLGL